MLRYFLSNFIAMCKIIETSVAIYSTQNVSNEIAQHRTVSNALHTHMMIILLKACDQSHLKWKHAINAHSRSFCTPHFWPKIADGANLAKICISVTTSLGHFDQNCFLIVWNIVIHILGDNFTWTLDMENRSAHWAKMSLYILL